MAQHPDNRVLVVDDSPVYRLDGSHEGLAGGVVIPITTPVHVDLNVVHLQAGP